MKAQSFSACLPPIRQLGAVLGGAALLNETTATFAVSDVTWTMHDLERMETTALLPSPWAAAHDPAANLSRRTDATNP